MPEKPEEWICMLKVAQLSALEGAMDCRSCWREVRRLFCTAQTKTAVGRSYYLKTGLHGEWIDAQPKTDACDRAHDYARESGWLCRQDPIPELLRLERSGSWPCQ